MEEIVVNFDTAKLAKDKGFNIPCKLLYNQNKVLLETYKRDNNAIQWLDAKSTKPVDFKSAPTQSSLANWILNTHGLFISVEISYNEWGRYSAVIYKKSKDNKTAILAKDGMSIFSNPIDAMEEGLQEALKLIPDGN